MQNLLIVALLYAIVALSRANPNGTSLKISSFSREWGSNMVRIKCEETYPNASTVTINDPGLFRLNDTATQLITLEGIEYTIDEGVLTFEIRQDLEGSYFCSRDAGNPGTDRLTILARPVPRSVDEFYIRRVEESVVIESGVGEGALAAHYSASFYKDNTHLYTNISRGEDFSLTISSLQLLHSGVYRPSVLIDTGGGDTYSIRNLPRIRLLVYQPAVIEVSPQSTVGNEELAQVSLTCIATGGPYLRVSWIKDGVNLTKYAPSHYNINNTKTNEGTRMTSTLTIHRPKYTDSGRYECNVSILDGHMRSDFKVGRQAELTILESGFNLRTLITEHKQVQLWVELHRPISLYAVTAMVYFSLPDNLDLRPQPVETHSIVANTTVMIFQLEDHEIPQKFRDGDFFIQVALRVNSTQSATVPNSLETASTANLNDPTDLDCDEQRTHRTAIISGFGLGGGIILLIVIIITVICCYKSQRTCRRLLMSKKERINLENQNKALIDEMRRDLENPIITQQNLNELHAQIKQTIEHNNGLLAGDSRPREDVPDGEEIDSTV